MNTDPMYWFFGGITAVFLGITAVFSAEVREGLMVLLTIGLFGLIACGGVKFVSLCDQAKQDIFASYHHGDTLD
jgi:hypothetical protein